jgi:hypothetical protein
MVRTLPFHGENTGSIPVGATNILKTAKTSGFLFKIHILSAQLFGDTIFKYQLYFDVLFKKL